MIDPISGKTLEGPLPGRSQHQSGPHAGQALSAGELAVLRLICDGHTSGEVAAKLERSVKTVEAFRTRIFVKLDARNVAVAVRKAIRAGLIEA